MCTFSLYLFCMHNFSYSFWKNCAADLTFCYHGSCTYKRSGESLWQALSSLFLRQDSNSAGCSSIHIIINEIVIDEIICSKPKKTWGISKKICCILSLANLQQKYFQSTFHILSIVPDHLGPCHYGNHWKAYVFSKKR